jgi:hypothetical protein
MSRLPGWWGDDEKRRERNRRTRKQEHDHAKKIGGKVQPGSGSSYRAPGDVRGETYLDELKWTENKSFTITRDLWRDIASKAQTQGREPRIILDFVGAGLPLRLVITEED